MNTATGHVDCLKMTVGVLAAVVCRYAMLTPHIHVSQNVTASSFTSQVVSNQERGNINPNSLLFLL
jgi:hypothetical protein